MFVHFGIYSQQGKGEWLQELHGSPGGKNHGVKMDL
ncbi:MAG: hypothetical protein IIX23_00400 [Oscillospiraceae bacterium]|nr:hypothetical protein [Oscillospiraceae bacterium]